MSFAFLPGLLGLLALPVIVALHLMRERTRRLPLSSLKLWDFLQPEVRGSKPRRIPISLLLILDLLIAALLALALSQPSVQLNLPVRSSVQYLLLIDSSTSMLADDILPERFARAKVDVSALLNQMGARDSATAIAFGTAPVPLGDTRTANVQDLLTRLYEYQAGGSGNSLNDALAIGMAQIDKRQPYQVHIYTDGAFAQPDFAMPITWHFYGVNTPNQAVCDISAVVENSDQYQVFAQLANFSDSEVARNITLLVDGIPVDSFSQIFPANSVMPQVWRRTGPAEVVSVVMMGGDQLKEDDSASSGLVGLSQLRIVLVEPQSEGQSALFQRIQRLFADAYTQVYTPQSYVPQSAVDLTLFYGWFPAELPAGSVLILQPPVDGQGGTTLPAELTGAGSWVTIPGNAALRLEKDDPLTDELELSGLRWGRAFAYTALPEGFETLLSANFEGQRIPLILSKAGAKGRVYVVMADLEKSNLTRHPAFPILVVKSAESMQQASIPRSLPVGERLILPDPSGYRSLTLALPAGSPVIFQQKWPGQWADTRQPGVYRLALEDHSGALQTLVVGVNAGSLVESDLAPREWVKVVKNTSLNEAAGGSTQAQALAPWLLAIAVVLMLWEASIAWR